MTVAYVVSSDGRDGYTLLTRFSILSVRYTNPSFKIIILCDSFTQQNLELVRDPILKEVDQVICVSAPDGSPSFRSRYVKTQIGSILEGAFLFLDSDTLVRGNLSEVFEGSYDIAGASNHSRRLFSEQIAQVDLKIYEKTQLPINQNIYINSGVLFFRGSFESITVSKKWHHFWKQTWNATGDHRDQPALNFVLSTEKCKLGILDNRYNAQVKTRLFQKFEEVDNCGKSTLEESALIWHFYASLNIDNPLTAFERELKHAIKTNYVNRKIVISLIKRRHPWRRASLLDDVVASQARSMPTITGWRLLWLSGRRFVAFRILLSRFKHSIINIVKNLKK